MHFTDFIKQFDHKNTIILLEGKRKVLPGDEPLLIALAEKLASNMNQALFRSGNASGSDELFARGVSKVDASRMEVILPYSGHRRQKSIGYSTHSLDDFDLAAEPEVTYHTRSNIRNVKLIDDFVDGINNHVTIKAAYLLRDTVKVIGTQSGIPKADFAIFYDDLKNPGKGGTGHTMMVCKNNHVPFVDQSTWFGWLKS